MNDKKYDFEIGIELDTYLELLDLIRYSIITQDSLDKQVTYLAAESLFEYPREELTNMGFDIHSEMAEEITPSDICINHDSLYSLCLRRISEKEIHTISSLR